MDVQTITQIIGTLGFPIAACIALFWQNMHESEKHDTEIQALRETIESNTRIISELYVFLKEVHNG